MNVTLSGFIKGFRAYLVHKYPQGHYVGSVYSNESTITYFPFTPTVLKEQQLKIAIVYNHPCNQFEVWLAGQNKTVQKKYWEFFKSSGWNAYHIPTSVETGLSIVDTMLVVHPDFSNPEALTNQIESGVMAFTDAVASALE